MSTKIETHDDIEWDKCPVGSKCNEHVDDHKTNIHNIRDSLHTINTNLEKHIASDILAHEKTNAVLIKNTTTNVWFLRVVSFIIIGIISITSYVMTQIDYNAKEINRVEKAHMSVSSKVMQDVAVIKQILKGE